MLGGHVDLDVFGTRALGILWLACTLAFVGAGVGAMIPARLVRLDVPTGLEHARDVVVDTRLVDVLGDPQRW